MGLSHNPSAGKGSPDAPGSRRTSSVSAMPEDLRYDGQCAVSAPGSNLANVPEKRRLALGRTDGLGLARAVLTSSVLVLGPYATAVGLTPAMLVRSVAGIVAVALGAVLFTSLQRSIRNTPQDAPRWILQAAAASAATLVAWCLTIAYNGYAS